MFFQDNVIVGVKDADGHLIPRSNNDTVRLPFDSEYSFFFKNLNWHNVAIELTIDGTNVIGDDGKITVPGNQSVDLERFCLDGDFENGKRFKFVKADSEGVQDPTSEDNGDIVIKIYKEKNSYNYEPSMGIYGGPAMRTKGGSSGGLSGWGGGQLYGSSLPMDSQVFMCRLTSDSIESSFDGGATMDFYEGPEDMDSLEEDNDKGATIEGADSSQKLEESKKLDLEESYEELKFKLRGEVPLKTDEKILCRVAIVLDKSGSMSSIRDEAIKGFNDQIKILQESPDNVDVRVTLITFESQVDLPVFEGIPVDKVEKLDRSNYVPGGGTAMLDGVGYAIDLLGQDEANQYEGSSFLVIVISDGYENSSKSFDWEVVSSLVCGRQGKGNWTFTYLGADQDLSEVTDKMGLHKGNVQVFTKSSEGYTKASALTAEGTKMYTQSLSKGLRATKSFYGDQDE